MILGFENWWGVGKRRVDFGGMWGKLKLFEDWIAGQAQPTSSCSKRGSDRTDSLSFIFPLAFDFLSSK